MNRRLISTWSGLALAAIVMAVTRVSGLTDSQCWASAVTTLCATWWIFESLPLAATALVPLAVFPLAGVLTEREVAVAYSDPIVLLFMGGFMLSKAAERWGAHRRIAQAMVAWIGDSSGPRIVLAFILTTAFISMWISNTATALMMLPVAVAVLENDKTGKLAVPLLLGIAYSASIGGIATPIGTPPNGVFLAIYKNITGLAVPFHEWMMFAGIVSALMLVVCWIVLCWGIRGVPAMEMQPGGRWTSAQKRTLVVFGMAALAWVTREIPFGGWAGLLESWLGVSAAGDTTVAIVAVLALFLIPSGEEKDSRLLDWQTAAGIPWGVLILFGGGIAIASAWESSGLSAIIGQSADGLRDLPPLATIGTVCLVVTFLSEVTSNTATSNILMPILGAAAIANGMDPAMLMIPATLSNSLAFMMPVGTPPNAIVYGTGRVRIADMVRYGFVLNVAAVIIVTLVSWWILPAMFGVKG
jgi:solute carrier family 13 (sodium-dependent dicarboxylate transporter), member 2/3/5